MIHWVKEGNQTRRAHWRDKLVWLLQLLRERLGTTLAR